MEEKLSKKIADDIAAAIKTAITDSETSMKEWVNSVLAEGYYTKAEVDGKITALQTQVAEEDTKLQKEIDDLKAALGQAESDLTAAYQKAIEDAVENDGVIDKAIADAVNAARKALQDQIDAINAEITAITNRLDALENNFANRIQSLTYIPTHTDRKATMKFIYAKSRWETELTFFVTPKSAVANIKQEHLSAKGIYTVTTRAAEFTDLLVVGLKSDTVNGTITVTLSGEHLSDAFFEGTEDASVFLMIGDGNSEYVSAPVELIAFSYMGGIVDPAKTRKGDYAMKDGTFIRYDANKTLTTEQKANVAGIVFWTTDDSNPDPNAQTPASLTADTIMNEDFPNCTHGLIVSLFHLEATYWNYNWETDIKGWLENTFAADNKEKYKSIISGTGATDPINYILGYQNTKLLKAYNAQCEEGMKYLHVNRFPGFSDEHPAPANTTGWYIPSIKELTLLWGVDMDGIDDSSSVGTETKTLIDNILNSLGDDLSGFYPSSTLKRGMMLFVIEDRQIAERFYDEHMESRPVCAF